MRVITLRRFIAILVGALAVAVFLGQTYSGVLRPQASMPVLLQQALQLASFALVALFIGFVVRRRGWLAAAAAYLLGLALFVAVVLRPSPPWSPSDVEGTWLAVMLGAVAGGVWSAFIGAIGSWLAHATNRSSTLP
jgi:hypothetical protein